MPKAPAWHQKGPFCLQVLERGLGVAPGGSLCFRWNEGLGQHRVSQTWSKRGRGGHGPVTHVSLAPPEGDSPMQLQKHRSLPAEGAIIWDGMKAGCEI